MNCRNLLIRYSSTVISDELHQKLRSLSFDTSNKYVFSELFCQKLESKQIAFCIQISCRMITYLYKRHLSRLVV